MEVEAGAKVQIEAVLALGQDINERMDRIQANVEQAVEISTVIELELKKQIDELDNIYD